MGSAKRRRINKDTVVSVSPDRGIQEETAVDAVVITEAQRSLSVQTEQTGKDIENLMCDNQKRIEEIHLLKQSSKGYPTKQELEENTKLLTFYTGFECFTVLMAVFEFVSKHVNQSAHHKLPEFDCFLLTIMKLRLNLSHFDLAFRFGICQTTAGRIFKKWIFLMCARMGTALIKWPTREAIQRTMPFCFRVHYGLKVTAIIDCFELFIEKPTSLMARACTWFCTYCSIYHSLYVYVCVIVVCIFIIVCIFGYSNCVHYVLSHYVCYSYLHFTTFSLSTAARMAGWTKPFPFLLILYLQATHMKPFNFTVYVFTLYHFTTFYSFAIAPGSIVFIFIFTR